MAGALVKRDVHLLLFNMLCDRQDSPERSCEREAESRDHSASPGEDGVESEKDCE